MEADYEWFKKEMLALTGLHLDLYKEKQMKRRIETYILRRGIRDYESFARCIRADAGELVRFFEYLTINVTEFFRRPEHWKMMEEKVLPELAAKDGLITVWSAACSTGEEPYSLAMSLASCMGPGRFRILATDIDGRVLGQAARGVYDDRAMEKVPEDRRVNFFSRENDGWKIREEIARTVEFRKMDLLTDPFPSDCDLIACRNILIYFTEEAKAALFEKFRRSLKTNGILFTGETEQIIYHKEMGYSRLTPYLYRRGETPHRNV